MSLLHTVPLGVDGWKDYLLAHLPRGLAWSVRDSRLVRAVRGAAVGFDWAHLRKLALYRDLNRNTMEDPLLAAWEAPATLDMVNQGFPPTSVVAERRANVLWFITRAFAQTVPWYVALAARWGATVTIDKPAGWACYFRVTDATNYTSMRCGKSRCGRDSLGAHTSIGGSVARLFARHRRAHARTLYRD